MSVFFLPLCVALSLLAPPPPPKALPVLVAGVGGRASMYSNHKRAPRKRTQAQSWSLSFEESSEGGQSAQHQVRKQIEITAKIWLRNIKGHNGDGHARSSSCVIIHGTTPPSLWERYLEGVLCAQAPSLYSIFNIRRIYLKGTLELYPGGTFGAWYLEAPSTRKAPLTGALQVPSMQGTFQVPSRYL